MNKDKILKNPYVVAVLSIAAVAFIVVNNVLPFISGKNNVTSETREIEVNPLQNGSLTQPALNPGMTIIDSLKKNSLQTVGWKRSGGRNPFLNEKRQDVLIADKKVELGLDAIGKFGKDHAGITLKKPLRPAKKLLQAISVGKSEKVVLIGTRIYHEGDTCNLGIIGQIGADSVLIHARDGARVLRL